MTTKFEIGKVYSTGNGSSYVWHYKVMRRTPKFITVQTVGFNGGAVENGEIRRCGVKVDTWAGRDRETAYPQGAFSMCPVIVADRSIP